MTVAAEGEDTEKAGYASLRNQEKRKGTQTCPAEHAHPWM